MRSHLIRWLAIPVLVAGMALAAPAAAAQTAAPTTDVPSVGLAPVGSTRGGPGGGAWFAVTLSPGEGTQQAIRIINPAAVQQTVRLVLSDMNFSADGTPQIGMTTADVGSWGGFSTS